MKNLPTQEALDKYMEHEEKMEDKRLKNSSKMCLTAGVISLGLIGKAIWLVLSIFLLAILNLIGAFFGMFALAFGLLTQPASIGYYISLVVSFFVTLALSFGSGFVENF